MIRYDLIDDDHDDFEDPMCCPSADVPAWIGYAIIGVILFGVFVAGVTVGVIAS